MKIHELTEMTFHVRGMTSTALKSSYEYLMQHKDDGKHTADIEEWRVLTFKQHPGVYLIPDVGMLQIAPKGDGVVIQNIYAHLTGHGFFEKMIWFLKTREHHDKIYIGDVQSTDTVEVIKRMAQRFNVSWVNNKTGDSEPYSVDNIDKFYGSIKKTDWDLLFENNGDYSDWPRFTAPLFKGDLIKESYEAFCDGK
jgi:hypothetical protein